MAIWEWVGNAAPVAQVESYEIGQTTVDDAHTFSINGKSITATATGPGQEEAMVDELVAAWNAKPYPECADAIATKTNNASANPYVVTFTASVPGRPYEITQSGNIAPYGTNVMNEGPNVWGIAGNYQKLEPGAEYNQRISATDPRSLEPAEGEEIHIRTNRPSILYNLQDPGDGITPSNALSNRQLSKLRIDNVFTGVVGLPRWNQRGYNEYLPNHLLQPATFHEYGQGDGAGSARIKIRIGNILAQIVIYNTGSSADPDYAALQLDDIGPTSIIEVRGGEVDFFRESWGAGGFIQYTQSGGTVRVLDNKKNGDIDLTSVDIKTMNNPTLIWNADIGGDAGKCMIHGGNIIFGDKTSVGQAGGATVGSMTIDGPASVEYNGKDIKYLEIDSPSARIDFSKNTLGTQASPVTVENTVIKEGQIITGDAWVTLNGLIPRGSLSMTYP